MKTGKLRQEQMRDYYDKSNYYDGQKKNFSDEKTRFNRYIVDSVFSIYLPKKKDRILDVGCGWGNISLGLQKRGHDVIGLDYSRKSIDICKNTADKLGLNPSKFVCKDATHTGFKPNHFDAVYCSDLVEHLYPIVFLDLLKEAHRILKNEGKLVIFAPCPSHLFEVLKKNNFILKKDVSHVDMKSMERLKRSLSKYNFKVVKSYYIGSHLPVFNFFENIFKSFIPLLRRRIAILAEKK